MELTAAPEECWMRPRTAALLIWAGVFHSRPGLAAASRLLVRGSSSSIMGGRRRGAAIGSSRASVSSSLAEAGQGSSTGEVRGLRRSAVPDNRLNAGSAGTRGGHHRAASGSAWRPPNVGLKLNVAGYSVSSPCTAVGGIIRDSAGNLRMAFQKFFCQGTTSLPAVDATMVYSFRKIRSLIAPNTEVVLCKKEAAWQKIWLNWVSTPGGKDLLPHLGTSYGYRHGGRSGYTGPGLVFGRLST
ncbi:uncharacterized protein M6B38_317415 [Iris pallida]|uniref:Uncharacterized protein n=1 Tax=Iris pallida TaxID=29817 RepID=A0AAX6HEG8_IRIPA|nr:uncharacterized protein M6B38_317415 [Iris pallida]